jgi:hypothetical protein
MVAAMAVTAVEEPETVMAPAVMVKTEVMDRVMALVQGTALLTAPALAQVQEIVSGKYFS